MNLPEKGSRSIGKLSPSLCTFELIDYSYPHLELNVQCSKGTYIRSLAYDIGVELTCGRISPPSLAPAAEISLLQIAAMVRN